MKNIFKAAFVISALLVASSCATGKKSSDKTVISPLSGKTAIKDGSIIYSLPRTVFNVVVSMERTIEVPGPYAKFAGDLLGLTNVIRNPNESWSIEDVTLESALEPDPAQFYVIETNTLFETNVLALKKEGLIMDINPKHYDGNRGNSIVRSEDEYSISSDLGSDEYFQVQRDTAFKRISLDSTFVRIPYVVEKRKKLSDDQLAERAAKRLMEMRDGKHLILTGESNVFPQNEAAINEMNRLEKEYTELFTGKIIKEKRTYTFQVIPEKEMAGKPVRLFQFSELKGVIPEDQAGGVPVVIVMTPGKTTKDITIINKSGSKDDNGYDRLYYRVPDVVSLKVTSGKEVLLNSRSLIYQFGGIIQLPSNYIIGK
jgi:hypothetical protein